MSDDIVANHALSELLKLPAGTVSATLKMKGGEPPILTVTRHIITSGDIDMSATEEYTVDLVKRPYSGDSGND